MRIEKLNVAPDMLGESPVWDPASEELYWVDVVSRKVRALHLASGEERTWSTPSPVGSIGLARDDSLVLALQDGFYRLWLRSSQIEPIVRLDDADPQMRLNDGKMDRSGRFLCGGMGLKADPRGALHRLTAPGRLERLADGIRIANSLCFSPDGSLMYFADSLSHKIMVYDYDRHGDAVGSPRLFLDTTPLKSAPDGATVDSEGHLWVALVQSATDRSRVAHGESRRDHRHPGRLPFLPGFRRQGHGYAVRDVDQGFRDRPDGVVTSKRRRVVRNHRTGCRRDC